jgi:GntR family transcriptional regulator
VAMAAKYNEIADDLRQQIQQGSLKPGQQLQAEAALAAEYRVSPNTLRRAVDSLQREGLVEKHQGVGTFIRKQPQKVVRSNERYLWEKDRVLLPEDERASDGPTEKDTGLSLSDLDFDVEYSSVRADKELAVAFSIPVGTRLLHRVHHTRRRGDTAPIALRLGSYLVYDMIVGNPDLLDPAKEPWPGGTQHQLSTVDIEIDRIVDQVTARPPTPKEARILDLLPGTSVLVIRKTSIDTKDRVVEISDTVWPGDRVQLVYTTPLPRWQS